LYVHSCIVHFCEAGGGREAVWLDGAEEGISDVLYMLTLPFGQIGLGLRSRQGPEEKAERSGKEEGMMCMWMSILNNDTPDILVDERIPFSVASSLQLQCKFSCRFLMVT